MRRLHIERITLDLRGVSPRVAEAAARQLGPALARALANRHVHVPSGTALDAGRLSLGTAPDAAGLAAGVAERIARKTTRA